MQIDDHNDLKENSDNLFEFKILSKMKHFEWKNQRCLGEEVTVPPSPLYIDTIPETTKQFISFIN